MKQEENVRIEREEIKSKVHSYSQNSHLGYAVGITLCDGTALELGWDDMLGLPLIDGAEDEEGCKLGFVEGWPELDGSWEGKLEGWALIDGELDFTKLGAVVVDGFTLGSFVGSTLKVGWSDGYRGDYRKRREKEKSMWVLFEKDTKRIPHK